MFMLNNKLLPSYETKINSCQFDFNTTNSVELNVSSGRSVAIVGIASNDFSFSLYFVSWNDNFSSFVANLIHNQGNNPTSNQFSISNGKLKITSARYSRGFIIGSFTFKTEVSIVN